MSRQVMEQGRNWYAIHTYAGYEDAVARNLVQRIESMGMEDKIFSVLVPKEKKIKIKNGKRQTVEEKIYPGYVLKVVDGPFKDYEGKVAEVDEEKGKVKVLVSLFGRETPVELDFLQMKRI